MKQLQDVESGLPGVFLRKAVEEAFQVLSIDMIQSGFAIEQYP